MKRHLVEKNLTQVRGYIASENSRNVLQLRQAQIEPSESYLTRTVSLAKESKPQMERGSGIFATMYPRIWVLIAFSLVVFIGHFGSANSISIRSIKVQGNKKIETDAILTKIESQKGARYNLQVIREDVKRLFKMGFFYNVEVDRQDTSNGIILTYIVEEKPPMSEIVFTGNKEVKDDDLLEASELKAFEILNVTRIHSAVRKIEKLYEEKGYFLAHVRYNLVNVNNGVRVNFRINENDKVKVKKINFLGNRNIPDGELEGVMATKEAGFFSFMSGSGSYRQELFDRDIKVLTFLYYNRGFVQAKVDRPQVYVTPDKKAIYITIRIEEGEQYSVGEVEFSGDLLFDSAELKEATLMEPKEIFSWETLQSDLRALQAKYGDLGYAFANIIPRTQTRPKERLVDITYEIDKGEKVYFGEINVVGNSKTRDKVLRRELKILEGELYNETNKRDSFSNVKRLGFFDDVRMNTKTRADAPNILDVDIAVKERNTGSIQVGAGYSSFNKFVFNGQVQQTNFLGRGQRLGVSLNISSRTSDFNINFTEPYFMDTEWSVGFDIYRRKRQLPGAYDEIREGGALRVGHPLAPFLRGFLRYKNEHANLTLRTAEGADPLVFPVETANGRLSSLTATLEYDKRNDRFIPSSGVFASSSIEYAGLGGVKEFWLGNFNVRYFKELFWKIVFRNNLTYGFIQSPGGREPPFNELFRLGGAFSLRGFPWFSVTRKKLNSKGDLIDFGGKQQFYYNGEFEFPLISEAGIRGVLFFDIGDADDILKLSELRSDAGFGFRWFSPIGPLRFEWGFPLDREPGERSMNFEFAIGTPF